MGMTTSAAAKAAGMLRPPEFAGIPAQPSGTLMDERPEDWDLGTISAQKLHELKTRLERVRQLGGAFAEIGFSPEALARLSHGDGGT